MSKLTINIILPFPVTKPVGGGKIMYEYANRLQQNGHCVSIFHSIKRPFKKSGTPLWFKQLVFALRRVARPKWFNLNNEIKSVIVPAIIDKYIPDAEIILSTWWQMTYAVSELSLSKGKKFNLIQGYEIWAGHKEKVDASFSLPVNHIVIAQYLQKLISEINGEVEPVYIPNAIDITKFFVEIEPARRNPYTVIMLYSEESHKDSATAIKVLTEVQKKIPALQVQLFGVQPEPKELPVFFNYKQKPDNLRTLYNQSAIFFSSSLTEGWALPPAEAMACGCAVVCTDIGGHRDYAVHEKSALLVQPAQISDMVEKLSRLITDNELRLQIAAAGNNLMITTFNWDQSIKKMEDCFYGSIKN